MLFFGICFFIDGMFADLFMPCQRLSAVEMDYFSS